MPTFPVRENRPYQETLRANITTALHELRQARHDGNPCLIDTLQRRLDWFLDRLERKDEPQ